MPHYYQFNLDKWSFVEQRYSVNQINETRRTKNGVLYFSRINYFLDVLNFTVIVIIVIENECGTCNMEMFALAWSSLRVRMMMTGSQRLDVSGKEVK